MCFCMIVQYWNSFCKYSHKRVLISLSQSRLPSVRPHWWRQGHCPALVVGVAVVLARFPFVRFVFGVVVSVAIAVGVCLFFLLLMCCGFIFSFFSCF